MYWMEFIIQLTNEGANLILFDDNGNELKTMQKAFENTDEIICFAEEMPKTLIETPKGELINIDQYKKSI